MNRVAMVLTIPMCLYGSAGIVQQALPNNTQEVLGKLIAQCSRLTSYPENTASQNLCNKIYNDLQQFIEAVDPKEKNVRELKQRNEEAQKIAWHRVATEKQSQEAPLLSFVIPCYNRAAVVRQTIESIYNQNLTIPFEVIAVDDASKDNSFQILQEYEKKYDNFFAYKNETNKKAPTTRNVGMLYARGTYICNADSDDIFESNSIMPMLTAMIEKDYHVCYFQNMTSFLESPANPDTCTPSNSPNNEFGLTAFLKKDIYTSNSGNRIFTKKSFLSVGGYLEKPGHDSWSFSLRLLSHGYKGYIHPQSGYYYKIWKNNLSMWGQDSLNKVNDISPLQVTRENIELFTAEAQHALLNYNEPDGLFIVYYAKKFDLLPEKTLHALFTAYKYEDCADYLSAYFAYNRALQKGARHPRIYLKQARAAINANRFDLAAYSMFIFSKTISYQ